MQTSQLPEERLEAQVVASLVMQAVGQVQEQEDLEEDSLQISPPELQEQQEQLGALVEAYSPTQEELTLEQALPQEDLEVDFLEIINQQEQQEPPEQLEAAAEAYLPTQELVLGPELEPVQQQELQVDYLLVISQQEQQEQLQVVVCLEVVQEPELDNNNNNNSNNKVNFLRTNLTQHLLRST